MKSKVSRQSGEYEEGESGRTKFVSQLWVADQTLSQLQLKLPSRLIFLKKLVSQPTSRQKEKNGHGGGGIVS